MDSGSVVSKPLHSISLGDMVESVDKKTRRRAYSKVDYIEHEQQDDLGQLLRILYEDHSNATQSTGSVGGTSSMQLKRGNQPRVRHLKIPSW